MLHKVLLALGAVVLLLTMFGCGGGDVVDTDFHFSSLDDYETWTEAHEWGISVTLGDWGKDDSTLLVHPFLTYYQNAADLDRLARYRLSINDVNIPLIVHADDYGVFVEVDDDVYHMVPVSSALTIVFTINNEVVFAKSVPVPALPDLEYPGELDFAHNNTLRWSLARNSDLQGMYCSVWNDQHEVYFEKIVPNQSRTYTLRPSDLNLSHPEDYYYFAYMIVERNLEEYKGSYASVNVIGYGDNGEGNEKLKHKLRIMNYEL